RFTAAGRADEQDIALVHFHVVVAFFTQAQALVMVVDGHRKNFLGPLLPDDVLIQFIFDGTWGGDIGDQGLGNAAAALLLVDNRLAQLNAFAADVDIARPFDQRS